MELLYADDLVIVAETAEMEEKGLRVNMGKTKTMASGINLHT